MCARRKSPYLYYHCPPDGSFYAADGARSRPSSVAAAPDVLLGTAAAGWLQHRATLHVGPRVLADERRSVRLVVAALGSGMPLARVGPAEAHNVTMSLASPQSPAGQPLALSAVLAVASAMSRMRAAAVEWSLIPYMMNPWAHEARRLRRQIRLRRVPAVPAPLSSGDAAALIDACGSVSTAERPIRTIIATMLLTGARLHEALGLSVADVDFARKRVQLGSSKTPGGDRVVPLFPQLERELRAYLAIRDTAPGPLFPALAGRGAAALALVRRYLAAAARSAGLTQRVKLSTLRQTYAAARMSTTEGGALVSPLVVLRELGIRSGSTPFGHVLRDTNALRSRSRLNEGVEYRRS